MRNIFFYILLSLVTCVPTFAGGAQSDATTNCEGTTVELIACVQSQLDAADHLLNKIYGVVIEELSAGTSDRNPLYNSEIGSTLMESERQWVRFKDAQCAVESAMVAPGTAMPVVEGQCLVEFTHQRIKFLRRVAEQIHWNSKLCQTDKASCVLPDDPP